MRWGAWAVIAVVVLATYSWVDPAETYHVSRDGLAGGLSRAATLVNFPIALVAIALTLIAVAALPAAAWWAAAPAIGLCATIPWFVDQDDLDARWVNAIPALGVLVALGLTVAAAGRAGAALAPQTSVGSRAHRRGSRRHAGLAAVDHGGARLPLSRRPVHGRRARHARAMARRSQRFTSATITERTERSSSSPLFCSHGSQSRDEGSGLRHSHTSGRCSRMAASTSRRTRGTSRS